ncbi:uncharacterized protein [Aegilops tauschii subsp. strangulata]|uniref:uncharacterized protein isoform X2 n=1 Tax=Aegilops tauschii subsp. strangulata TaxID=200361 RepID=UPI001ABCD641|nr:uncharacterized protein LOC109750209 isoform X2 [Aegilops tauschii subsp. strangulata]
MPSDGGGSRRRRPAAPGDPRRLPLLRANDGSFVAHLRKGPDPQSLSSSAHATTQWGFSGDLKSAAAEAAVAQAHRGLRREAVDPQLQQRQQRYEVIFITARLQELFVVDVMLIDQFSWPSAGSSPVPPQQQSRPPPSVLYPSSSSCSSALPSHVAAVGSSDPLDVITSPPMWDWPSFSPTMYVAASPNLEAWEWSCTRSVWAMEV